MDEKSILADLEYLVKRPFHHDFMSGRSIDFSSVDWLKYKLNISAWEANVIRFLERKKHFYGGCKRFGKGESYF